MVKYEVKLIIECETIEQAIQIVSEKVNPDEDYGFPYMLTWVHLRMESLMELSNTFDRIKHDYIP